MHSLQKDQIFSLLWKETDEKVAARDFKVALNALNKVLEPNRAVRSTPFLKNRHDAAYGLNLDSTIELDTSECERWILDGLDAKDQQQARLYLQKGLELYTGDYLPERRHEDWCLDERERLQVLFLRGAERIKTLDEIEQDQVKTIPIQKAYETKDKDFLRMIWDALIYTHNKPSTERYEEYLEDMLTQRNLADVYHALNVFNISKQHNGLLVGTGEVERIKVPTLVLQGTRDLVVPEKMALEIMEDIGEDAELVYLENCGHSPLVDDLDQLMGSMEEFLSK